MRLSRGEVRAVRRWMQVTAADLVRAATPDVFAIDRRDRYRVAVRPAVEAELRVIGAGRMELPTACRLRDVSIEGLAVETDEPVAEGERVQATILPPAGESGDPLSVLCTVRWCRPATEGWAVGCDAGVDWLNSLCDLVRPHDLPMRVA